MSGHIPERCKGFCWTHGLSSCCDEEACEESQPALEIVDSETDYDDDNDVLQLITGDLYVLGRLWIDTMKAVLVGAKMPIILPVVKAAKEETAPNKPPPMKYTDLPIYDAPHFKYKDNEAACQRCSGANRRTFHELIQPIVRENRIAMDKNLRYAGCQLKCAAENACKSFCAMNADLKKYMRDPNNMALRQGLVASGALTGFVLAWRRGIPAKLIYTTLGALAAGSLCFPQETDEVFRTGMYNAGKFGVGMYNSMCGKHYELRERVTCKRDVPAPLPKAPDQCKK